ncbi:DUF305 domain-containing protein [Micromonosporaceae bacterium Da 78-11]
MRRALTVLAAALLLTGGCGTASSPVPAGVAPAGSVPAAPAATAAASADPAAPADPAAASVSAKHDAGDVAFVQALIPHHRQGIALASATAAKHPDARTLAQAIIVTQQDEVVRMTSWLKAWGVAAPPSTAPVAPDGDPLRALIAHQEEAIPLAQREQANGGNLTALAFAKQVIESRTAQSTELRGYLR